eukprot:359285-Chlamydomonas_euryale.AAC.6
MEVRVPLQQRHPPQWLRTNSIQTTEGVREAAWFRRLRDGWDGAGMWRMRCCMDSQITGWMGMGAGCLVSQTLQGSIDARWTAMAGCLVFRRTGPPRGGGRRSVPTLINRVRPPVDMAVITRHMQRRACACCVPLAVCVSAPHAARQLEVVA